MDWFLPLLGGFGIGTLISTVIGIVLNHWLNDRVNKRERFYIEKKKIYYGYLDALHNSEIDPSECNAKLCGNWWNKCKVFGSAEVNQAMQMITATNEGPRERRRAALELLFKAMRSDLEKTV